MPSQNVYQHAEEKNICKIDDKEFGNCPKGFDTIFKYKRKKVQYLHKGFYKVYANFVGIEALCKKCNSLFFSKSQLYKYLEDNCIGTTQPSLSFIPSLLALPTLIIRSRAVIFAIGSGLAF